jgi:hypothetical protein
MTFFTTPPQYPIIIAVVGSSTALFLVELILVFPARYADPRVMPTGTVMQPVLRAASSLSAISRTAAYIGVNPCWSTSSIYLTITSSCSSVSFFELGWQLHWAGTPVR